MLGADEYFEDVDDFFDQFIRSVLAEGTPEPIYSLLNESAASLLYEGGNDNDEHGDDTPRNIYSRIDTTYPSDVYNILGSSSVYRSHTTSNRPPGE
jgi:hypothetical protein